MYVRAGIWLHVSGSHFKHLYVSVMKIHFLSESLLRCSLLVLQHATNNVSVTPTCTASLDICTLHVSRPSIKLPLALMIVMFLVCPQLAINNVTHTNIV